MEELFETLFFFGMIALAIYGSRKKREQRLEELRKKEAERQKMAAQSKNVHKSSSNDIVRRRKENEKAAQEIQKRRLENEKAATVINNRRVAQQAEADSTRIHSSLHEKEEKSKNKQNAIAESVAAKAAAVSEVKLQKYDFEDQDLMQEVYDLMAYGCDGSDFLRRLEKENHFQSSLDATINA